MKSTKPTLSRELLASISFDGEADAILKDYPEGATPNSNDLDLGMLSSFSAIREAVREDSAVLGTTLSSSADFLERVIKAKDQLGKQVDGKQASEFSPRESAPRRGFLQRYLGTVIATSVAAAAVFVFMLTPGGEGNSVQTASVEGKREAGAEVAKVASMQLKQTKDGFSLISDRKIAKSLAGGGLEPYPYHLSEREFVNLGSWE